MNEGNEVRSGAAPHETDPIYTRLNDRLELHRDSAVKRSGRYKKRATFFNYCLPLLALSLIILISFPSISDSTKLLFGTIIAALLTVLSSVNSVMRPLERYQAYTAAAIEIESISFDLDLGIRRRNGAIDTDEKFFEDINQRITAVGERMASLPVPRLAL